MDRTLVWLMVCPSGKVICQWALKTIKSISLLFPGNSPGSPSLGNNQKYGQRWVHKHVVCLLLGTAMLEYPEGVVSDSPRTPSPGGPLCSSPNPIHKEMVIPWENTRGIRTRADPGFVGTENGIMMGGLFRERIKSGAHCWALSLGWGPGTHASLGS